MTANPFQALALQLMAERGFTIAPDGSIQVPAATVTTAPDASDAHAVDAHAHADADDAHADAHAADELSESLAATFALFARNEVLDVSIVQRDLGLGKRAAQYRLHGLAAAQKAKLIDSRGHYTTAQESAPCASAPCAGDAPHGEDAHADNGRATLTHKSREKRTNSSTPESLSMNTVGSKSIGSNRALQSLPKDKSIEHSSDPSDEYPHVHDSSIPPAPATSPEPPATNMDDLDEDERDAYEAEAYAVSGRTPIRLNMPKLPQHARAHQRYSPTPPTPPKPRATAPVIPVMVEDDSEEEQPAPPSAPTRPSLPPYDPYAAARCRKERERQGYAGDYEDEPYDPD